MKKFISSFLLCFALLEVLGQVNLVPNPSFEERTGCPQGFPDLDGKCNDWLSYRASPDYFNNCSSVCGYDNNRGFQEPHTGESYIGIATYHSNIPNNREHLGVQLNQPLIIGTKYFISFYASPAFKTISFNIACNKLGILFTTISYSDPDGISQLQNDCQIYENEIIQDTVAWHKVYGSFVADSTYDYLVIGNFFNDSQTDTLHYPNPWGVFESYYYIDDICVSTDSIFAQTWTTVGFKEIDKSIIEIYPNPTSDLLNIKSEKKIETIQIVNPEGNIIYEKKYVQNIFIPVTVKDLSRGIYFLKVKTAEGWNVHKILII